MVRLEQDAFLRQVDHENVFRVRGRPDVDDAYQVRDPRPGGHASRVAHDQGNAHRLFEQVLAVAELARNWKKLLKEPYWEYTAWSVGLFMIAAFNWYGMH